MGSGWACASATERKAAAARRGCSSRRFRPLKAACAPKQVTPVRRSAQPTSTVSRLHPHRRSAWRAFPAQYCSVISA